MPLRCFGHQSDVQFIHFATYPVAYPEALMHYYAIRLSWAALSFELGLASMSGFDGRTITMTVRRRKIFTVAICMAPRQ